MWLADDVAVKPVLIFQYMIHVYPGFVTGGVSAEEYHVLDVRKKSTQECSLEIKMKEKHINMQL